MQIPIWTVQSGLVISSLSLVILALRRDQRLLAGIAALGLIAGLLLFAFGPRDSTALASNKGQTFPPPANHATCAFGDVYQGLSDILGNPAGPVTEYKGMLVAPLKNGWLAALTGPIVIAGVIVILVIAVFWGKRYWEERSNPFGPF